MAGKNVGMATLLEKMTACADAGSWESMTLLELEKLQAVAKSEGKSDLWVTVGDRRMGLMAEIERRRRPMFEGESNSGEWKMTINPESGCYEVSGPGFLQVYPNFDEWSEENNMVSTRRQLEIEQDYFNIVRFVSKESAIAAAMDQTAPDNHKSGVECDCAQCLHYR